MNRIVAPFAFRFLRDLVAVVCSLLLLPGDMSALAPQSAAAQDQAAAAAAKLPPEQLDSLVAPIALYPDPLLSQTLVASTYPLEIIQLQQWLGQHKDLKDQALADAVKKQDWDPSIQSMAAMPDVVKRLSDDIKWTTDLGNAFLAQQSDVMDAVQRMRKKAQDKGLKSNEQMKVETQTVENKQVVVIQQANPQVIQVPSYDPVVVYGAPPYPYPPIYYPPPPPSGWAVAGGMALSFGVGVAMGAMWGGGWGYGCGWGHNDVDINVNNNFNRNTNIQGGNRVNAQGGNRVNARGGNTWQHNPQHRGGAPYSDRATANKFGGSARGDSISSRQANARQNQAQRGNAGAGVNNRAAGGAGNRGDAGGVGNRGGAGGSNAGNRGASAGTRDVNSGRGGGGGGDKVGNRSVPSGGGSRNNSAFGNSSGGFSGSNARSSSARGSSSMGGSRGGGGGSRGGGRRR
jgi:hypothetical protein